MIERLVYPCMYYRVLLLPYVAHIKIIQCEDLQNSNFSQQHCQHAWRFMDLHGASQITQLANFVWKCEAKHAELTSSLENPSECRSKLYSSTHQPFAPPTPKTWPRSIPRIGLRRLSQKAINGKTKIASKSLPSDRSVVSMQSLQIHNTLKQHILYNNI